MTRKGERHNWQTKTSHKWCRKIFFFSSFHRWLNSIYVFVWYFHFFSNFSSVDENNQIFYFGYFKRWSTPAVNFRFYSIVCYWRSILSDFVMMQNEDTNPEIILRLANKGRFEGFSQFTTKKVNIMESCVFFWELTSPSSKKLY